MMNITQDFIPVGRRNRPGKTNLCSTITIHNTGNSAKTAGAKNHAAYLKAGAADVPASWHYTVDDKEIIQHLPDTETAIHAGSSTGNASSIGIEICMNEGGDLLKATDNAVELTAELCRRHGLTVDKVVQHNVWWGKDCPQMLRQGKPYTWDTFLRKVGEYLAPLQEGGGREADRGSAPSEREARDEPSDWARAVCEQAVTSGLIKGDGKGWFGWREPVSLERLLVILHKIKCNR